MAHSMSSVSSADAGSSDSSDGSPNESDGSSCPSSMASMVDSSGDSDDSAKADLASLQTVHPLADAESSSSSTSSATTSSASSASSSKSKLAARPQSDTIELLLESRDQHLSRHNPANPRKDCPRCQYQVPRKRKNLERVCFWTQPITQKRLTWLMQHPLAEVGSHKWGLGCSICHWAGLPTKMAKCEKTTFGRLSRHQKSGDHQAALKKFTDEGRVTSTSSGGQTPDDTAESRLDVNVGHGHVIKILQIFQEQNSIRSFTRSVEEGRIMQSDLNPGNASRTVARNLVTICAALEKHINRALLMNCSIWGLGQDGKDQDLLVATRMVLWCLPKGMHADLPDGVSTVLPPRFGSKGPWVAERAIGCARLGSDRCGEVLAKTTIELLRDTVQGPGEFTEVVKKGKFFTADNAADETVAHESLRVELGAFDFDIPDTTHSVMLGIKNGCKGDLEVDLVRAVFITNKRPIPSIARCLKNSSRFRKGFTDEQRDDIFTTISHMGWAPHRHSSQSRPWTRGARKIRAVLGAMATEINRNGPEAKACLHNMRMMAPFGRMMIAGLLGDLTAEHLMLVPRVFTASPEYCNLVARSTPPTLRVTKQITFQGPSLL